MDDSRRLLEIEDRLGEMTHALAGLRARNDQAVRYLSRELEDLAEECQRCRDSWAAVTARAEALLTDMETDSRSP